MKLILYFSLLFLLSCKQKPATNYHNYDSRIPDLKGKWSWTNETSSFELTIDQVSDSIYGSYCAVAQSGNKIDCADEKNLTYCIFGGRLKGDSALIWFNSAWSEEGKKDTALLIYTARDTSLTWKSENRHILSYVPTTAILKQ